MVKEHSPERQAFPDNPSFNRSRLEEALRGERDNFIITLTTPFGDPLRYVLVSKSGGGLQLVCCSLDWRPLARSRCITAAEAELVLNMWRFASRCNPIPWEEELE